MMLLLISSPAFSGEGLSLKYKIESPMGLQYGFPETIELETVEILNRLFNDEVKVRGKLGEEAFDVVRRLRRESGGEDYLVVSALIKKDEQREAAICGDLEHWSLFLFFRTNHEGTQVSHIGITATYASTHDACDTEPDRISFKYKRVKRKESRKR
jgi:hypothetical protein